MKSQRGRERLFPFPLPFPLLLPRAQSRLLNREVHIHALLKSTPGVDFAVFDRFQVRESGSARSARTQLIRFPCGRFLLDPAELPEAVEV